MRDSFGITLRLPHDGRLGIYFGSVQLLGGANIDARFPNYIYSVFQMINHEKLPNLAVSCKPGQPKKDTSILMKTKKIKYLTVHEKY